MKIIAISATFAIVMIAFAITVIRSTEEPKEDDSARKQLNDWQDRDILED